MKKQKKHYISELDKFLREFDLQHPTLSESQRREVEKFKRIAELRDKKRK